MLHVACCIRDVCNGNANVNVNVLCSLHLQLATSNLQLAAAAGSLKQLEHEHEHELGPTWVMWWYMDTEADNGVLAYTDMGRS
jgi:hypothetical protein